MAIKKKSNSQSTFPSGALVELTKVAEAVLGFSNGSGGSRSARQIVDEKFASPSIRFLLEPYENGYWEFRAKWNTASTFSQYILDEIKLLSDIKDWETNASLTGSHTALRKLGDDKRDMLLRITSRVSPINHIFRAVSLIMAGKDLPKFSTADSWISQIDLKKFQQEFSQAVKIFNEKIYVDGAPGAVDKSRPVFIKSGLIYFIEAPSVNRWVHVVSPKKEEVQAFADFYSAIGVISAPKVQRVFAPDEKLFQPYFLMLSGVLPHIVKDDQISRSFSQALDYYENSDYQHCISTLGIIAEGYLHRVYSSLLREEVPAGLTLGQTVDKIHRKISELISQPKTGPKPIDSAYELINKIEDETAVKDLKPLLREFVSLVHDSRINLGKRIDEITKVNTRISPFPGHILDNLNELLKWRNAASHNSRIPLGGHETDRALFCLVRIITWWQDCVDSLDWSKSKVALIEELISAAK